jgi:hypothetical protein
MKFSTALKMAVVGAGMTMLPALATVTGTNLTVTTSVDPADTSSLTFGVINGFLYTFNGRISVVAELIILGLIIGLIVSLFAGLTKFISSFGGLKNLYDG